MHKNFIGDDVNAKTYITVYVKASNIRWQTIILQTLTLALQKK